jgi:signal transduction histidine kinase
MAWLRRWRFEAFLVALAAVEVATVAAVHVSHKPAALVITALSVGVLAGKRWQPLAALIAAFALLTLSVAVMPRSTSAQFFGTLATFAIAGTLRTALEAGLAWLAGAAMLGYAAWVDPLGGGASDFLLSLAFGTTMWGAGLLVARRGRHLAATIERAARAESERLAHTRRALAEERATIARELHDLVSHGLSVTIVQTVAARSVLADVRDPAVSEVDRHLQAAEATARDALNEMRRMLGLLQNEDGELNSADRPPTSGLRQLDELVARVAPGRPAVRLSIDEDLCVAPGLELAMYRIVQEGLTNVVKHAPGAAVDVEIHRSDNRVTLSVTNTAAVHPLANPPVGAGRGLMGVRQRAALYDGSVSAGSTPDGGYALVVAFPATPGRDAEQAPRRTSARS